MATKRKLIPFSEGRTTGDNPYETGYRVGRAFSARNMRASRRSDQYNKARQEERYTGKSPGKPPPAPIHRAMAGYKAIDRIRDRTVDRYQRHTQNPRRGPMTRAIQGRQTRRDYDKGVEDARHNYRQSRGSIETGEGPGGKDYIPDRVGAGDISTGDLGKKIRFSMNRRSRRNPPEWSYRDKDIAMDKLKGFMDADDEGEEWKKGKNNEAMENSNMKYSHDKILAESASLTLSDLEQLQSAPGPVTERQKYGGNKGDIPDADREKKGHFGRGPKTRETAKEEGEIDFKNGNGLSGKQEDVMDTDKDGDIDAKDLKNLRGKKKGKKRQKYGGNKGDIPDADRKKKGRFGRGPKTRATAKEEGEIDFSHKRTLGDILSERRRGKPGTPKGEEHARDTEERTEIRQKHEDEVASSDGGPYVARDIKVGSYQPPIYGSGGSRRPKKKPGHKGDERRLSRLARHRRSLKKKK